MDAREMDNLVQRLVQDPHDEEVLAYAHQAGQIDPRAYAMLLEKTGQATTDPAYAAHWLTEAANVWSQTLGDAHSAARALMGAIEKDPTRRDAVDRLAQLYRDKGDRKALVALLERNVKALAGIVHQQPDVREPLAALYEELGRLWSEPPLTRPERALENWKRLAELDPQNTYAIYAARELMKSQQMFADAIPFFAMEQALVDDADRKIALYRDEADIRLRLGQGREATAALRAARHVRPEDVALAGELATNVLARLDGGEKVGVEDLEEARGLLVSLAEQYDGEYGFSYAVSALRCAPGDDRAMQLADHYGRQLGRDKELAPQYAAYVAANPNGFMAQAARGATGSRPPPPPAPNKKRLPSLPPGSPQRGDPAFENTSDSIDSILEPLREVEPVAPPAPPTPPTAASAPASDAARAPQVSRPEANPVDVASLLEQAAIEVQKGRKPSALQKYREVLKLDPASSEALAWVEDHLRQKRMYAELRDVLMSASRVSTQSIETRKAQLRDVAGLCETQLRDLDTAISACRQIVQLDRGDDNAREQLRRLLEKGQRWDELATLLEQEAMGAPDVESKIALERKLATLHEQKRKDTGAAAEAWARIASLAPQDESAIQTAVKLFEKADQPAQAAGVLSECVGGIEDKTTRGNLLVKLGELRATLGEHDAAGDAFAEAAEALAQPKLWEQAESGYAKAERWAEAANAVDQRFSALETAAADPRTLAVLAAQAGTYFAKAGDPGSAVEKLQKATELDPTDDQLAKQLADQLREEGRLDELVTHLLARGDKVGERDVRVKSRKRAAAVQKEMGDTVGARDTWILVLNDGDEEETLRDLALDAEQRADHQEHADFLKRLAGIVADAAEKLDLLLREARLVADELDDADAAIERYETIAKLSPGSRETLRAIADLYDRKSDPKGEADALERELATMIVAEEPTGGGGDGDADARVEIAQRLARLYEGPLEDVPGAIRALSIVHAADPEDFDAVARLMRASETTGDWPKVAEFLAALIEVEGDEEEASQMTRRHAEILGEKLGKNDEALAVIAKLADQGDEPSRAAYVELGDKLGWKGLVATKLVEWYASSSGTRRNEALRQAFDRFLEVGRDADAAGVGSELARVKTAGAELGAKLEEVATRLGDIESLTVAHDLLVRDKTGTERAGELVRQAEAQVKAGVDPLDALQHGEASLTSVPPTEVEGLLTRLAKLTAAPGHAIDLYERQVGRCRTPLDRLNALARAAQVAVERGSIDRARGFFEIALSGGVGEEIIVALEDAARRGDEVAGATDPSRSRSLRTILAEALAAGGQGSRDGGRTRAALLRRAALLAHRELHDLERAFQWIGDALVTLVDDATLAALDELGAAVGDPRRVEATLSRAVEEVFDGPLVRKLLSKRSRMRRDVLGDRQGAAADLKRLHDLAPADQDVMNELSGLLQELGDHRGMIQLYEDQILRGRDPGLRSELARKVARLWEEEIGDVREAADAWRRVLRMKAGDAEATEGLERAKGNKLRRSQISLEREAREALAGTVAQAGGSVPANVLTPTPGLRPSPRGPSSPAPASTASAPPRKGSAPPGHAGPASRPSSPTMADMTIPTAMAPLAAAAVPREWAEPHRPEATSQPLIEAPSTDDGSAMPSSQEALTPLSPSVAELSEEDEELGGPTIGLQVPPHIFGGPSPFGGNQSAASEPATTEPAAGLVDLAAEVEHWDDATGAMARPQPSAAPAPIDESALFADSAVESPDFLSVPFDPRARQGGGAFGSSGQDNYGQGHPQQGYAQQAHPEQGFPQQGYPQQAPQAPEVGAAAAHSQQGYEQPGYDQPGYQQPGLPQQGYPQQHADYGQAGYPQQGYERQADYGAQGFQPGYAEGAAPPVGGHGAIAQTGYGPHAAQSGYAPAAAADQPGFAVAQAPGWGHPGYGGVPYPAAPAPGQAPLPVRTSHPDGGPELASDDLLDDDIDDIEDVDDAELLDDDDGRP